MKIIRGEPKRTGVIEIERELDALEASENFVSDLKIYDYLNLLKPSSDRDPDDTTGIAGISPSMTCSLAPSTTPSTCLLIATTHLLC